MNETSAVVGPAVSGPASLAERLADDMVSRWAAGERPFAEEYLERFPELRRAPDAALELIAEELALRQEYDLPVSAVDLAARFPLWPAQVRALVRCQNALGIPSPRFPEPGDALGDFQLASELGRGAHGRVYLATQSSLGDRPVVLKLAPPRGHEHLSLARLQHTHIVPLYSVHEFPDHGLRGLCLPYFGGATLDRSPDALPGPGRGSARADAVCRIGACLADALQYAHERELLHLDVKPSNVLIAADGTPMLLDFHLARAPLRAGAEPPAWLGGTPGYMPPEQTAAANAVWLGRPVPADLDGRADVYALGLVLAELLGGPDSGAPAGLVDVLTRCTAPDPRDRYPTAGHLAADLRRHLSDLPLRGVPNRSPTERWRKWRRRHPLALPLLLAVAAATALAAGLVARDDRHAAGARAALVRGEGQLGAGHFAAAAETLRGGEALLDGHPFRGDLRRRLSAARTAAEGGRAADELHAVCEQVRPLYDAPGPPSAAGGIGAQCHQLWTGREQLVWALDRAPPEAVARGRADLLDLAILTAHLEVVAGRDADARTRALAVLDEAEALFGAGAAIDLERARHLRALGYDERADDCARRAASKPARTSWEHLLVGRAALAAGDAVRAEAEVGQALALDPTCFWGHYYRGACRLRAGDPVEALAAFTACTALAPDRAWCVYNRGLARVAAGHPDRARDDFDRALALDPDLGPAYLARAAVHHRAGRTPAALDDLRRAAEAGVPAGAVDYQRAVVFAPNDRPAAVSFLRSCLATDPGNSSARELLFRLTASEPAGK